MPKKRPVQMNSQIDTTNPLQQKHRLGLTLHKQGKLSEAATIYKEILRDDENHFDAIHLLGVVSLQTGNFHNAVELLSRAIALNPNVAGVHSNCGTALASLKRLNEAIVSFDKAIALKPDYAEVYSNRGNALQDLKHLAEAIISYDKAIALKPDFAEAYSNRGNALKALKRLDEAIISFDKAIALKPDYAEAYSNRGMALQDLKRLDEALISYDRAIALKPDFAEAYSGRGSALKDLKRLNEAIISFDKAIALKPDYAKAYSNRGTALQDLKRFDDAIIDYDKAIALKPDFAEAYSNRGTALQYLERLDEAIISFDKAIALKPDFAEAYSNRGNALKDLKRLDEAIISYQKAIALNSDFAKAYSNLGNALTALKRLDEAIINYDRAIELRPDYADAYANKGLASLLRGEFASGWRDYEWRKKREEPAGNRFVPKPLWLGEQDLAGKSLFIHWEQGLGDTIQFCRYALLATARGARVVLSVQDALLRLLKQLEPEIVVIGSNQQPSVFDLHCPLLSLPLAFNTTLQNIPSKVPYLQAEPDRIAQWTKKLGRDGFKIGICWQGSATKYGVSRSFPITEFIRVSKIENVRLISLQKGDGENQLQNLPDGMCVETLGTDFDAGPDAFLDTAAVMKCCDLVITCDTAIEHVAGALGVPVWVALQYVPDWRWMLDRSDSPWYPTMRLFRQKARGDWKSVFIEIENELNALLIERKSEMTARNNLTPTPYLPVSWGEVIDKITILEIKRSKLVNEKALTNVTNELSLLSAAANPDLQRNAQLSQLKDRLAAVNEALWEIEDNIREKEARQEFDSQFIELARSVYKQNDERAAIKREINMAMASELLEEKSYSKY